MSCEASFPWKSFSQMGQVHTQLHASQFADPREAFFGIKNIYGRQEQMPKSSRLATFSPVNMLFRMGSCRTSCTLCPSKMSCPSALMLMFTPNAVPAGLQYCSTKDFDMSIIPARQDLNITLSHQMDKDDVQLHAGFRQYAMILYVRHPQE